MLISQLIGLIPFLSALVTAFVGVYTWQQRVAGARAFALFAASIFVWTFLAVPEFYSQTLDYRALFGKLQYLGIVFMPVAWFVFTLRYTQRDGWLKRRGFTLLLVIPLLTLCFTLTDSQLGLVWQEVSFISEPFSQLVIKHGVWFDFVLIPYSYLLFMSGAFVLSLSIFNDSSLFRKQTAWVLVAAAMPFLLNVLYLLSDLHLYGLDPTPYGFTLSVVITALALFGKAQMRVTPVSYRQVFLNTEDAALLLNNEKEIIDLNPAALKGLALKEKDVLGQSFEAVFPQFKTIFTLASNDHLKHTLEFSELTNRRFVEVNLSPLLATSGDQTGYVLLLRDVTLENEQRVALESFAFTDSLTGAANRHQLTLESTKAFALAKRYELKLALLYIDLDGFKAVNDRFGHEFGDEVLIQVANCLNQVMRENDIVARMGGDEFAVLLHNSDLKTTLDIAERLQHELAQLPLVRDHDLSVEASVGYALYPDDGENLAELLRHADTAMYQEKRNKIKS